MIHDLHIFPHEASTMAPTVDALFFAILAISVFFTLLIFALVIFFAIKYRRRSDLDRPSDIANPVVLEVVWIGVPFAIMLGLFFWGAHVYFQIERPPENAIEIHVVAKQWMWKLQHPNGRREIDTLHVPVGIPVRLVMASQDVVHSFFVPAFRIKQDVIPGRYTTAWFEATDPGTYHLFCSQYCGDQHSGMIGSVVVMSAENYQSWLAGTSPDESPVDSGAALYASLGCNTCHGIQAPTLAGLYMSKVELTDGSTVIADEDYLRQSIMDSGTKVVKGYGPIMPSFRGQITEDQLIDLIAYIKSMQYPPTDVNNNTNRPLTPAINHGMPQASDVSRSLRNQ